jgi:hypothetical protein
MNRATAYGLPTDLEFDIRQSARNSISLVRRSYAHYLGAGANFFSWNDPTTPADETFDTFMTIAYQFFVHAETAGQGYGIPARRLMRLLEVFNEELRQQYDQQHNTPAADEFRATLLVTALSYAFQSDLRSEFRSLQFPIRDATYDQLMNLVMAGAVPTTLVFPCMVGSNFTFSFQTQIARSYTVESTDDLSAKDWAFVESVNGDGSLMSCSMPMTNKLHRFFRVRQP